MPRPVIPDAHDPSKKRKPTMLTTDLSLRVDPAYEKISRRFLENPQAFAEAFARAWFKLTHRDLGPRARYMGPEVPKEELIWQDPVPAVDHPLIDDADVAALKAKVLASGLTVSELVGTAWASASTFRGGDKRGGANGARIRLAPQKDWEVNQPAQLAKVLKALEVDPDASSTQHSAGGKKVSLADLIVLAGNAGVEQAAKAAGHDGDGAVHAGPHGRLAGADRRPRPSPDSNRPPMASATTRRPALPRPPRWLLIDKAQLLTLTAPEMTVLIGGLRAININVGWLHPWRLHGSPGCADERLLRQPAGHGHAVEGGRRRRRTCSKGATARPARSNGPARASTSSSARTRCCALWPRSMPARMRRRSSSTTSSTPGPR